MRRLKYEQGYKAVVRTKKSSLTKASIALRLQYARTYKNKPKEFWYDTLFMDEKSFALKDIFEPTYAN